MNKQEEIAAVCNLMRDVVHSPDERMVEIVADVEGFCTPYFLDKRFYGFLLELEKGMANQPGEAFMFGLRIGLEVGKNGR